MIRLFRISIRLFYVICIQISFYSSMQAQELQVLSERLDSLEEYAEKASFNPTELVHKSYQLALDLNLFQYNNSCLDCPRLFERSFGLAKMVSQNYSHEISADTFILVHKNHGRAFRELHMLDSALNAYELAWNFIQEQRDSYLDYIPFIRAETDLLLEWALTSYDYNLDLYDAIELLNKARSNYQYYIQKLDESKRADEYYYQAYVIDLLGRIYFMLGNYDLAHTYIAEALEIANNIDPKADYLKFLIRDINVNLASALLRSEQFEEAENKFLSIIYDPEYEIAKKTIAHNNLGVIYNEKIKAGLSKIEFSRKSERHLRIAKRLSLAQNDLQFLSYVHNNWGDLKRIEAKYAESLDLYHQAMLADLSEEPTLSTYEVPSTIPDFDKTNPIYFLESVASKAQTFLLLATEGNSRTKELKKLSLDTYLYALGIVDSLIILPNSRDFQMYLKEEVFEIYEGAIEAAMANNNKALAFQISDQAKAGFLLSSLNAQNPKFFAGVDPAIIAEERDIRLKISKYEVDAGSNNVLKGDLLKARLRFKEFTQKLKNNPDYQDYYNLRFKRNSCSLPDIKDQLDDSTSLIQYFVGEKKVYIFHIKKEGYVKVASFDYDDDFVGTIKKFLDYNSNAVFEGNTAEFFNIYQDLAHELYQKLLGGINKDLEKNLLIIPDGPLAYIPFEALITSPVSSDSLLNRPKFLIWNHIISYAYSSCQALRVNQLNQEGDSPKSIVGFAPTFQAFDPQQIVENEQSFLSHDLLTNRIAKLVDDDFFQNMSELPNQEEIKSLEAMLPVSSFRGENALLGRFLVEAEKHGILHLATHGYFNDKYPKRTRIYFTPISDGLDNERLFINLIYGLSLKANLVVLSACQTQLGEIQRGEGIFSLAQAFTYAGAKSTVATLWEIPAESNKKIMTSFYGYLKDGMKKSEALHYAKIDFLSQNEKYPRLWAGPILTGNVEVISFENDFFEMEFFLYIIIIIFVLTVGYHFGKVAIKL